MEELRARYDELRLSDKDPQVAQAGLRSVYWRHAMNAVEAFPGDLEQERSDELGDLGIKGPRLECLATMLAAYASALGGKVDSKDVLLKESSTVDSITLR